jgi:hypothetical protein
VTSVCLSVGYERKSKVLIFGLARMPLLLFGHRCEVCSEKGKSVEIIVESVLVQFPGLLLVADLPCFVEPLQG